MSTNKSTDSRTASTASKAIEIIPGKLFWISDSKPPKNVVKSFYFNIDEQLQYEPFYKDFGPLNLANTWKYTTQLQKLLNNPQFKSSQIYHYTSTDYAKASNAAYLMGAFQIIVLGLCAQKAYQPFANIKFVPFRDASYGDCTYKCTILDCLRGLDYAIKLGWFKYKSFNLAQYEHYERVQNGDLNWTLPGKFVSFSSPSDQKVDKYGNRLFTPADYVPIFKKMGVTMVIRLNNKTYDAAGFTKEGIKHHDLYFTDGTAPSIEIVEKFLKIVEEQPGAVAVHCKAGLGRTGALIACYAMKHYGFHAADFIGWIRLARPGSILGPQQHFLIQIQKLMKQKSKTSTIWKQLSQKMGQKQMIERLKNLNMKNPEMNQQQRQILQNGDFGQGQRLVDLKKKRQIGAQDSKNSS